MKYSYKWLKQLSGTKKDPQGLSKMIGLKGFELEEIEVLKDRFKDFVVGEIISLDKHPYADKLQFVRVDIGGKQIVDIVCGAWNIEKGDKVPVALPGSILPQNKLAVEKREIRGVVSYGMLCAEDELGLGKDHEGIMVLGKEAKPGTPISEVLDLDDKMMEFDVLPNRAHDCLSHLGMAREICAMEGRKIEERRYRFAAAKNPQQLSIRIEDVEGCSRYIGAVLEDVKIGPSPKWMQARLVTSGMEPINNVVDITNYVMLELGNPLHAFDYNRIEKDGVSIIVRKARKGEQLELLDETGLELENDDMVIADEEKAIALAGIKGGKYSGISQTTTKIVLEAANFNSLRIRKSRQHHGLATEAQARFEKQISPKIAELATARAIELLEKYAGAKLVEIVDENRSEQELQKLELENDAVQKLLGHEVKSQKSKEILENLGFGATLSGGKILVKVPFWRLDIEGPEDLIEEIGRIVGYEEIPDQPFEAKVEIANENVFRKFQWELRNKLSGIGFDEVTNYSFYGMQDIELCAIEGRHFEIEKPLSNDLKFMRKSLLPGLLRNVALNKKSIENMGMGFDVNDGIGFALFEMGNVYLVGAGNEPREKKVLSGILYCEKAKEAKLFYDAKGRVESLLENVSRKNIEHHPLVRREDLHSGRSSEIVVDGKEVGIIGEVDRAVSTAYGIKKRVVFFELELEKLFATRQQDKTFVEIRKFPPVLRDLSMYVHAKLEAAQIAQMISNSGGEILKEIVFFDQYQKGAKKSLACHLIFWDRNRTLTNQEVEGIMEKITADLGKQKIEARR